VGATECVGFPDLPRELGEIVYNYIFDDLRRTGILWADSSHDHSSRVFKADIESQGEQLPPREGFSDCTIMRTCHQIHQEFAAALYGQLLQISSAHPGHHMLSLSRSYASLVRRILVGLPAMTQQGPAGGVSETVRHILRISKVLTKTFPGLVSLQLIFGPCPMKTDRSIEPHRSDWQCIMPGSKEHLTRDDQVAAAARILRSDFGCRKRVSIPKQLAIFQRIPPLERGIHPVVDTPLCEAFRNVRDG
jgi:hypothetical protein